MIALLPSREGDIYSESPDMIPVSELRQILEKHLAGRGKRLVRLEWMIYDYRQYGQAGHELRGVRVVTEPWPAPIGVGK